RHFPAHLIPRRAQVACGHGVQDARTRARRSNRFVIRCSTAAAAAPVVVATRLASLQQSTLAHWSAGSVPPRVARPAAPKAAHHDGVLRRALRSERTAAFAPAERKAAHSLSTPADCWERLVRLLSLAVVPAATTTAHRDDDALPSAHRSASQVAALAFAASVRLGALLSRFHSPERRRSISAP